MTHALARAFQQARRIGEHRAVEEANIRMRFERVDISERGVPHARDGAAVVQEFANVGGAAAHAFKPRPRHQSMGRGHAGEPSFDLGISSNRAVEPQKIVHAP